MNGKQQHPKEREVFHRYTVTTSSRIGLQKDGTASKICTLLLLPSL